MKITVIPSKNKIKDYLVYTDSFIFPLQDFSFNYETFFSLEEIIKFKEENKEKDVFVCINKPIYNDDIESLKETLIKLNGKVDSVLFYDISILKLTKELELKYNLIWDNPYMLTNYNICNFYLDNNVNSGVVSNEITINEIKQIKEATNMKLMLLVLGKTPVAFSKRKLVTNYYKSKDKEIMTNNISIVEPVSKKEYLVKENSIGTYFNNKEILNGLIYLDTFKEIKIDYLIFKEEDIEHSKFISILDKTKEYLNKKIISKEFQNDIKKLIGNNTFFLDEETIFKVKNDEKN